MIQTVEFIETRTMRFRAVNIENMKPAVHALDDSRFLAMRLSYRGHAVYRILKAYPAPQIILNIHRSTDMPFFKLTGQKPNGAITAPLLVAAQDEEHALRVVRETVSAFADESLAVSVSEYDFDATELLADPGDAADLEANADAPATEPQPEPESEPEPEQGPSGAWTPMPEKDWDERQDEFTEMAKEWNATPVDALTYDDGTLCLILETPDEQEIQTLWAEVEDEDGNVEVACFARSETGGEIWESEDDEICAELEEDYFDQLAPLPEA